MTTLQHFEAAYTDVYQTDVLFEAVNDHPPIRATRVTVYTDHVSEAGNERTVRVRVTVTGDRLQPTDDGWATAGPAIRAYGLAEEPVRYDVCREAVLEALQRHGLEPGDVAGFALLAPPGRSTSARWTPARPTSAGCATCPRADPRPSDGAAPFRW
ncbi:hypothetical protein [Ornithinimicrobium sp. W1665]|uniref:hypothetical protein n=1 Tax=Ornithinimicrobium sp. W1665 TaxID=3416666 RepID=UPI003D6C0A97